MQAATRWIVALLVLAATACVPPTARTGRDGPHRGRPVSIEDLGLGFYLDPAVVTTVHRGGAGDLDGSGWCRAASTGGGFAVSVPTLFNDATLSGTAADGVAVKIFVVGTRDDRNVCFLALRWWRADGRFEDDPVAAAASRLGAKGLQVESEVPVTQGGLRGTEVRAAGPSSLGLMRVYRAAGGLYQLIAEGPKAVGWEGLDAEGRRFMDSFSILDGTAEEAAEPARAPDRGGGK